MERGKLYEAAIISKKSYELKNREGETAKRDIQVKKKYAIDNWYTP